MVFIETTRSKMGSCSKGTSYASQPVAFVYASWKSCTLKDMWDVTELFSSSWTAIFGLLFAGMLRDILNAVVLVNKLKEKHKISGDVRGKGLMLGIEMVKDSVTKTPATAECAQVVEAAKDMGLLLGKGGLWGQTIRFAPPMCITQADADFLLAVLDEAFGSV